MMARAEWLAAKAGCSKLAVISGVGARGYYRKLGYELDRNAGGFMIKELPMRTRAKGLLAASFEAVWTRPPLVATIVATGAFGLVLVLRARR
jgi:hypothetical protein